MKKIRIEGVIGWDYFASDFRRDLADAKGDSLMIDLYSPGGDVIEGLEIYGMMMDYSGHLTVRLGALTASAATLIPCAANWVIARSNTIALIHRSWACICGDTEELGAESRLLDDIDRVIAQTYARRINRPLEVLIADMGADTWLMGGDAIVEYGLADAVEPGKKEIRQNDESKKEAEAEIEQEDERKKEAMQILDDINIKIKSLEEVRPAAMFPRRFAKKKKSLVEKITNKDKQEVVSMPEKLTLDGFLGANPEAKSEHEAIIARAVAEVEGKCAEQVKAAIENTLDIVAASGSCLDEKAERAARNMENAGAYALSKIKSINMASAPKSNVSQIAAVSAAKSPADTAPPDKNQAEIALWDKLYGKEAK